MGFEISEQDKLNNGPKKRSLLLSELDSKCSMKGTSRFIPSSFFQPLVNDKQSGEPHFLNPMLRLPRFRKPLDKEAGLHGDNSSEIGQASQKDGLNSLAVISPGLLSYLNQAWSMMCQNFARCYYISDEVKPGVEELAIEFYNTEDTMRV